MVNRCAHIFFCFVLLTGCRPDVGEMREGTVILQSTLRAGATAQEVRVYSIAPDGLSLIPRSGEVTVRVGETTIRFERQNDSFRSLPDEPVLGFGETGVVRFVTGDKTTEAPFTTPGALTPTLISVTDFNVDVNAPFDNVFTVSWLAVPGFEYVATLQFTGDDPQPIPFAGGGGFFSTRFSGPFPGGSLSIRANDFANYGPHTLCITAVDYRYRDLHFYSPINPDGTLRPGISNVTGGHGFVTAVADMIIPLEVIP